MGSVGRGAVLAESLAAAVEQLDTVLALDPTALDGLDADVLRDAVSQLARIEGQATAAMASAVAALDRTDALRADGASSMAAWLAARTGTTRRVAARRGRLAADLDAMRGVRDALAAGEISEEAADTIVRAGRDGRLGTPSQVEAALLPVARGETPEALRAEITRRTHQTDGAALARDEGRQRALRRFALVRRDDGMWQPSGLLPDALGEKARTLLDAYLTADPIGTAPDDRRRPEQKLADAFEAIVDVALDLGPTPTKAGVARPHLSVVVDLATFDADLTDPDDPDRSVAPDHPVWATLPPGQTAWGQTISPQAVRALCCDAGVSRVVTAGDSQVLDVGRLTPTWSAPQRRAIAVRDRSCRGPGCGRPIAWTQIHHIRWWRNGGDTDLANGIALCPACHDLIHHRGWTVQPTPTPRRPRGPPPPDGPWSPTHDHPRGPCAPPRRGG